MIKIPKEKLIPGLLCWFGARSARAGLVEIIYLCTPYRVQFQALNGHTGWHGIVSETSFIDQFYAI